MRTMFGTKRSGSGIFASRISYTIVSTSILLLSRFRNGSFHLNSPTLRTFRPWHLPSVCAARWPPSTWVGATLALPSANLSSAGVSERLVYCTPARPSCQYSHSGRNRVSCLLFSLELLLVFPSVFPTNTSTYTCRMAEKRTQQSRYGCGLQSGVFYKRTA